MRTMRRKPACDALCRELGVSVSLRIGCGLRGDRARPGLRMQDPHPAEDAMRRARGAALRRLARRGPNARVDPPCPSDATIRPRRSSSISLAARVSRVSRGCPRGAASSSVRSSMSPAPRCVAISRNRARPRSRIRETSISRGPAIASATAFFPCSNRRSGRDRRRGSPERPAICAGRSRRSTRKPRNYLPTMQVPATDEGVDPA